MAGLERNTYIAAEPLPVAALEALQTGHPLDRNGYNPDYLDIVIVESLDCEVPVVTFKAMSRYFQNERTVYGVPEVYSLWGYGGLEYHTWKNHSTQSIPQTDPACDCGLSVHIENVGWRPLSTSSTRYSFLPQTLEEILSSGTITTARQRPRGINLAGAKVIEGYLDGIKT
jgi:hypothetical protein